MSRITVKITTESGESWTTPINVSLEAAKNYFLGQLFDVGVYPVEKMEKVTKVEEFKP